MIASNEKELITEFTRDLVLKLSPEEEPFVSLTSQKFFESTKRVENNWDARVLEFDQSTEATKEAVFLTPILLSIVTSVVGFLREEIGKSVRGSSSEMISNMVRRFFQKFQKADEDDKKNPPISLTSDQLTELHNLIVKKAMKFKLSKKRAKLLADTIIAGLVMNTN